MKLPDATKHDLMRRERPAWVRRLVAGNLSVRDRRTRDLLLVDPDPEIRWSTLQRTVPGPDDALRGLLSRLAADRKERLRFQTEGNDEPTWDRRTPSEYETETLHVLMAHPSTPHSSLRYHISPESPKIFIALLGTPSVVRGRPRRAPAPTAQDPILPATRTARCFRPDRSPRWPRHSARTAKCACVLRSHRTRLRQSRPCPSWPMILIRPCAWQC